MTEVTDKTNFSLDITSSVSTGDNGPFAKLRKEALEAFAQIGLPGSKSEEYKFTPITKGLTKHFSPGEIAQSTPSTLDSIDKFGASEISDQRIVLVNGKFDGNLSSFDTNEITITHLRDAIKSHPGIVKEYFGKHENSNDPFALLNTALWQDGIFIHVAKNKQIKKPLLVHHINDTTESKVAAHTRLLVVLEQGSDLTMVEKTDTTGENTVFNTITEEIIVNDNASFTYCKIQNDPGQVYQVANTTIHQSNASRANTYTFTLDGQLIRNNLNILIDGEGCESHFYGLYLTGKNTLVDNHTVVDHRKAHSFSNELYKGLMDGNSKGVFNGKIFVRPNAQKTNAFQSNRNVLLSDTASVNTKPQLEIWADDVKCSHGCTSGQLDEEALFYLQSRGIPKATAKAMLLYAFAADVFESIPNESIKNFVDQLVSERLHKNF